jgi:hypothetical protein
VEEDHPKLPFYAHQHHLPGAICTTIQKIPAAAAAAVVTIVAAAVVATVETTVVPVVAI